METSKIQILISHCPYCNYLIIQPKKKTSIWYLGIKVQTQPDSPYLPNKKYIKKKNQLAPTHSKAKQVRYVIWNLGGKSLNILCMASMCLMVCLLHSILHILLA